MDNLPHILVVDDEPFNIEIITELLDDEDIYRVSSAEDGDVALKMMEASPEDFDVILLDRMMPNISGMEVLAKMKAHEVLSHCPVIFQTAKASTADISEGIQAGAHYYLTKPFEDKVLLSVVKTAVQDRLLYKNALASLGKSQSMMGLLRKACFEFKTLDEARNLASLLSHVFPEPDEVVMGLTELMINAVEHGNLGISYEEKSELNSQGTWEDEVNRRLSLPENGDKNASIKFEHSNDFLIVTIEDDGDGFDWESYMDFDTERVMDNHGRGIAVANKLSFSEVEYSGKGNVVFARLYVDSAS